MKKVGIAMVLSFIAIAVNAQSIKRETIGFSNPESVIEHNGKLYVTNVGPGLDPSPNVKDGNGFISKVDYATGKIVDLHFLPKTGVLNSPKGTAIIGTTLYVADVDRVVGFDLNTQKTVFEVEIPGVTFLNDIILIKGRMIVSETVDGKLYEIDVQHKKATPLSVGPIPGANGFAYDSASGKLYCVGFKQEGKAVVGGVYVIDLQKNTYKQIPGYQGLLDGAVIKNGKLWFSDWKIFGKQGVLVSMDLKTHVFKPIAMDSVIAGPADFILSADRKFLIIPALLEGKLLWKQL